MPLMKPVVGVAVAGAAGALARWGLSSAIGQRFPGFPWGTPIINVSGSFLLGLLFVVLTERTASSPTLRLTLTTGLMGAYTTFSTFSYETVRLVEEGAFLEAALNVVTSLGVGLPAAAAGLGIAVVA